MWEPEGEKKCKSVWWTRLNSSSSVYYNAAQSLPNKLRKICKKKLDDVEIEQGHYIMLAQQCRNDMLNGWLCFSLGQTKTNWRWQPKVSVVLLQATGGSHQPIRILWTGFILPGNLENCSRASKHHPLCNCVNKIIKDLMIKRAPMTGGLLGCRRTCVHRRERVWVTEDYWKDSTVGFCLSGDGRPPAGVQSKCQQQCMFGLWQPGQKTLFFSVFFYANIAFQGVLRIFFTLDFV